MMVRYKNDAEKNMRYNEYQVADTRTNKITEELTKYQNVSTEEIVKFGLNRFTLYKKMKYNVLALEV